jgi:hypothetical protein
MHPNVTPKRAVSTVTPWIIAMALVACPAAAMAAVTCTVSSTTVSGDTGTPDYYNTALNATVVTRTYLLQMVFKNTTSTQEQIAVSANWVGGLNDTWVSAANATKYRPDIGVGLAVRAGGPSGTYATSSRALANQQTIAGNGTVSVAWQVVVELKRTGTIVAATSFGLLGNSYAFGGMFYNRSSAQWEYPTGCTVSPSPTGNGFAVAPGVAPPTPPTAIAVKCTINGGAAITAALPQVQASRMATIGALPSEYAKQRFPLQYACTGTGGVTNPAYTIALAGTKGGNTNALASDKTNVGVMVEASSNLGETPTVMVPGSATDYSGATRIPLRDAGQTGGSQMTLIAYPVRTGSGTISAGPFKASGTLKVFTN